jgi:probable phosphoglycerate mutase
MPSLFDSDPEDKSPATGGQSAIAYTDGGARGNPGPAGYGVHIVSADGETLAELSRFLGIQTNNFAEYCALLGALEWALANRITQLRVVSDSELMVKQMQGRYKVASPGLRPLYDEARARARQLKLFRIEHVLRGKNKRADALANAAMDEGSKRSRANIEVLPAEGTPVQQKLLQTAPKRAPKGMRGIVKAGAIHLLDDELPDGTIVYVMCERDLK